jgi:FtsP/CotA-like multicopper oxidase with cupredoxin domain
MYMTYPFGLDVNSFQIMQIDHLKRTDTTWIGKQIPTNPLRKPPFEFIYEARAHYPSL